MTDLPAALRAELAEVWTIERPSVSEEHVSADGTIKFQMALTDGRHVETVYIPDGRSPYVLSLDSGRVPAEVHVLLLGHDPVRAQPGRG